MHTKIRKYFRMKLMHGLPYNSSRGTREMLWAFMNELGFKAGVEIGTQLGHSAEAICKAIPGVTLACVDPWMSYRWHSQEQQDKFYEEAVNRLKPYNVIIKRIESLEALNDFSDESLDFVNIDGSHDFNFAITDIILWAKKVRLGGIIAVHDYDSSMTGVMRAVDSYTHCNNINPWYSLCEGRRRPNTAFWVNGETKYSHPGIK